MMVSRTHPRDENGNSDDELDTECLQIVVEEPDLVILEEILNAVPKGKSVTDISSSLISMPEKRSGAVNFKRSSDSIRPCFGDAADLRNENGITGDEVDPECLQIVVEEPDLVILEEVLKPIPKGMSVTDISLSLISMPEKQSSAAVNFELNSDSISPCFGVEMDSEVSVMKDKASTQPQFCVISESPVTVFGDMCSKSQNTVSGDQKSCAPRENQRESSDSSHDSSPDSDFIPLNNSAVMAEIPPSAKSLHMFDRTSVSTSEGEAVLREGVKKVVSLKTCYVDLSKSNILITMEEPSASESAASSTLQTVVEFESPGLSGMTSSVEPPSKSEFNEELASVSSRSSGLTIQEPSASSPSLESNSSQTGLQDGLSAKEDFSGITFSVEPASTSTVLASEDVDFNQKLASPDKALVGMSGMLETSTAYPSTSNEALLPEGVPPSNLASSKTDFEVHKDQNSQLLLPDSTEEGRVFPQEASIPCPNTASGSGHCRSSAEDAETQPPQRKPRYSEPWISSDAAENADNNDPKWELLRKIRSDEERYRVMRERWKNLTIPDPKRDLTVHNYRMRRMNGIKSRTEPVTDPNNNTSGSQSRKRARSPDGLSVDEPPPKRVAHWSCTYVLDQRVAAMRQQMHIKSKEQHRIALYNLSLQQNRDRQNLLYRVRGRPPAVIQAAVDELHFRHEEELQDFNSKFNRRLQSSEYSRLVTLFEKASEEIRAFHKFYHQLNHSDDDQMRLSDGEVDELEEADHMYQLYDTIYQ